MDNIQKNQGKEINRILGNKEYDSQIKTLEDEIKKTREYIKEVEKKLAADTQEGQRLHNAAAELKDKYMRLKEESQKKRIDLEADAEKNERRDEVEILEMSIASLKKTIKLERAMHRKNMEGLYRERDALQQRIKEAEQEKNVGLLKVSELRRKLKHNQLRPLDVRIEESGKAENVPECVSRKRPSVEQTATPARQAKEEKADDEKLGNVE